METFIDNPYFVSEVMSGLDDVITCSPNDRLLSTVALATSSHEPVFVFQDGHFLGLVALHQLLFKNRVSPVTKVSHEYFRPPYITTASSLFTVMETMFSTRVYILPIYDDNKTSLIGVIQAANLFKYICRSKENLNLLAEALHVRSPITASSEQSVASIYHLFRKSGVARIVLTDDLAHLNGIISRGDLQNALFGRNEELDNPTIIVKQFMQRNVFHVPSKWSKVTIVQELIEAPFNSVVLTDSDEIPTGIVSNRDILEALVSYKPMI